MQVQWIFRLFAVLAVVILSACSSAPDEALKVRQFHLRDTDPADVKRAQMVRGEQMYRLKGAVTLEEQQERLGDYYTVTWRALGAQPTGVVMDFNQASTGADVHRMHSDLPAGAASGKVEFKVSGDDYNIGGRVLAWRIRLMQDNKILAEKRSYLWR
ncbi:MAG: hypothetical protein AB8F34_04370 [Akkermansiaceae bacterium]